MVRLCLLTWFTLTTLLGPGLCCCSLRLVAVDLAPVEEPPADGGCPCCRHDPVPDPLDDATPPCRCPCKQNSAVQATVSHGSTADSLLPSMTVTAFSSTTQARAEQGPRSDPTSALPFHSTSELLHVFHFLRC